MSTSVNGKRIVFIGAGNVASHLAPALDKADGLEVVQVFSRTLKSAVELASRLHDASPVSEVGKIDPTADIYIVSLVDDAVEEIVRNLSGNNALWLHTSGSLPKESLATLSDRYGVFYPLQTFSKDVEVNVGEVPVFIEGNTREVEAEIREIAGKITDKVYHADEERRRKMHIAAVFACNFANHLWTIADGLLGEEGLTLEVLHPLLRETLRKAMTASPASGQTGPAVRGDSRIMDKHVSMLPDDLGRIYRMISGSIYDYHHKNNEQD